MNDQLKQRIDEGSKTQPADSATRSASETAVGDEREALIDAAISNVSQVYDDPDVEQMASRREYVADAIGQLVDAGWRPQRDSAALSAPSLPLPDDFARKVESMDAPELRARILRQWSHLKSYAECLDGLGLLAGLDRCRTAEHIREAFAELSAQPQVASPDDIRAQGWAVAVHNDYRLDGVPHTFWLFTRDGVAVKGEGRTDAEALAQVRAAITSQEQGS